MQQQFLTTEARDVFILERHAEHLPLRQIGQQVGLSHEGVRKVINTALKNNRKTEIVDMIQREGDDFAREAIHNLREIALDTTVSPRTRVEAWDKARLFWESQRKLYGADEPIKRQEVTDTSSWEAELRATIAATERENERRAAQANQQQ
jgi:hypothetical protein